MSEVRSSQGARRRPAWRLPAATAVVGHLLLVPVYLASRWYDLSQQPYGSGHWPGEPGWPAGSGSSEWGPGVPLLLGGWLLCLALTAGACIAAAVTALTRRLTA